MLGFIIIIRMISRIIELIIPLGHIKKIQENTRKTIEITKKIENTSQEVKVELLRIKLNEITMSSFSSPNIS